MSTKIKLILAVLALVAILSVYSAFSAVRQSAALSSQIAPAPEKTLTPVSNDMDHDGLSDSEEAYWETDPQNPDTDGDGFKDGEEVASGHDPTVPGPDDVIGGNAPKNITDKVNGLVLSGLVEGSLMDDGAAQSRSLDAISDEILRQAKINAFSAPPQLTVVADTADNVKAYDQAMSPVVEDISKRDIADYQSFLNAIASDDYENNPDSTVVSDITGRIAATLDSQIAKLGSIPTPQAWKEKQIGLISLLQTIRGNYLLYNTIDKDPYQGLISLSVVSRLMLQDLLFAVNDFATLHAK